jgi:predicted GIY-YIG superfamily endonuclease
MINMGFTTGIKIPANTASYGYIIKVSANGFHKVGTSRNIENRIYQHLRYSPFESASIQVLLLCVFGSNKEALEWEFNCKKNAVINGVNVDGDWIERGGEWVDIAKESSTYVAVPDQSYRAIKKSICSILKAHPVNRSSQRFFNFMRK